jgi:hypothetical protein
MMTTELATALQHCHVRDAFIRSGAPAAAATELANLTLLTAASLHIAPREAIGLVSMLRGLRGDVEVLH